MKIVHCVPHFLPSEGGLERAVFYLARKQSLLGHTVKVFTFNSISSARDRVRPVCNSGLLEYELIDDIEVYRFSYSCLNPMGLKFSFPLAFKLLREKPDIIHLHAVIAFPNIFLVGLCGEVMHVPVVLTAHGIHEVSSILSNRTFGSLGFSALKLALKNVSKCIALTESSKLALLQLGVKPEDMYKITNGVDLQKFKSHKSDKSILRKYGVEGSQILLCVSRIARNKGLDNLIAAASEVSKKFSNINFVIVGRTWDREYKQYLENLVKKLGLSERVIFAGNVPDQDLMSFYKLCTIFSFPSNDDTAPLVVLEAMAAGCPIVSTRVGFTPEIIDSHTNGILVNRQRPEELAKWIAILLRDTKLREAISRKARETVKNYSWKEVARKTVEVYLRSINV